MNDNSERQITCYAREEGVKLTGYLPKTSLALPFRKEEIMNLSESQLLEYRLQMESLICEREGMIALNKEREHRNEALAYPEREFINLGYKFKDIHKHMVWLMDK